MTDTNPRHELVRQCLRIERECLKIAAALGDLSTINQLILKDEELNLLEALTVFQKQYGHSLLLMRKLAFIIARFPAGTPLYVFCERQLGLYGRERRNIIALAAADSMDEVYHFVPLRRSMLDFVKSQARVTQNDIVDWTFRPMRSQGDDIARQLQSHGLFSLLDATIFIMSHARTNELSGAFTEIVSHYVPSQVRLAWDALNGSCPQFESVQWGDEPQFADTVFYRQSIAWIEYDRVARFRSAVDQYSVDNETTTIIPSSTEYSAADSYFGTAHSIADLAAAPTTYELNITKFDPLSAGMFGRTAAFIRIVRAGRSAMELTPTQTLQMVGNTADLAEILSRGEIVEAFGAQPSDLLQRYICHALIYDCAALSADWHRLRRTLQELVVEQFNSKLLNFAEWLYERAPHVARHFVDLCSEAFLVQLYILFPQTDLVYETKAQLLEWTGERYGEDGAKERAKALRVDQRLQRIRGEIDDVRIYVDPVRFGLWLQDNTIEELSSSLRFGEAARQGISSFVDLTDLSQSRRPHVRIATVLQLAFNEFCTNKRYGVDSYIGRRIRHGTLKGNLFTQLVPIIEDAEFDSLRQNPSARAWLDAWSSRLEKRIDH